VIEFAFAQAAARCVPLVAQHVWARPAEGLPARLATGDIDTRDARVVAERQLADALAAWSDKCPDVVVRHELRHSLDPAVALTAASRRAGLVVVGLGRATGAGMTGAGMTGAGRLAGSVAQALVRRAGCPVAVIPTG
jgi:nucleotide-binding universal stress UspA family protein